ncbi:hypothetical protein G1E_32240 [Pseudomonas sp. TJI-51]|nr:hypothetical protein G1E_32240 [Pseudomonas sp. TJI-51]
MKQKYACKSDGELSRLLGVTKAAVSLQKAGRHEMSIKQAVKVAELLHVNPMAVICGVMYHQDPAEAEFWLSVYEQTVRENDRRQYFSDSA